MAVAYVGAGTSSVEQVNAYPGLDLDPADAVVAHVCKLSGQATTTKVALGTEAGFFQVPGIPTVVCGPGFMEGQGHKPDEYVAQEQLIACASMLGRVLDELSC
ncbi:M20/M25/M40 family metallo-hydrolase [Ruegeria marina]|uniref:M20/M25/M40 family metallo-hydrolase n=1 Tax=Ruegeria marina TaxID=639004 RepID=UPI000B87D10D|nr:M20/M25/M40 family metallo-hydrolase [Ruegeria marina]